MVYESHLKLRVSGYNAKLGNYTTKTQGVTGSEREENAFKPETQS